MNQVFWLELCVIWQKYPLSVGLSQQHASALSSLIVAIALRYTEFQAIFFSPLRSPEISMTQHLSFAPRMDAPVCTCVSRSVWSCQCILNKRSVGCDSQLFTKQSGQNCLVKSSSSSLRSPCGPLRHSTVATVDIQASQ